jgi:hypothetical protein
MQLIFQCFIVPDIPNVKKDSVKLFDATLFCTYTHSLQAVPGQAAKYMIPLDSTLFLRIAMFFTGQQQQCISTEGRRYAC